MIGIAVAMGAAAINRTRGYSMDRKRIGIIAVIGVVLALVVGVLIVVVMNGVNDRRANAGVTTERLLGDFAVNTDDQRALVGFADHYFIATVKATERTDYRNEVSVESNGGRTRSISEPYTTYTVSVVRNVKGELPTGRDIQVTKAGGVSKDGKSVVVYEDDALLEAGATYALLASVQPDGSLLIAGPNSSERIGEADAVAGDDTYESYYRDQIPYERERYTYR